MQKTMLAAVLAATLGMGASAQAADLNRGSLKDAPVYMPASTWTGFYFGAGGGGGAVNHDLNASWAEQQLTDVKAINNGNGGGIDLSGIGGMGGFGTVQVGYDRQLDQHFVIGAFFDYDFANFETSLSDSDRSLKATITDTWTVGGRLGYLVNSSTLVYGLAGYTEAHLEMPLGLPGYDFSGWTAGAGIETSLGGPLFLKGELPDGRVVLIEPGWAGKLSGFTLLVRGTDPGHVPPDAVRCRCPPGWRELA